MAAAAVFFVLSSFLLQNKKSFWAKLLQNITGQNTERGKDGEVNALATHPLPPATETQHFESQFSVPFALFLKQAK